MRLLAGSNNHLMFTLAMVRLTAMCLVIFEAYSDPATICSDEQEADEREEF